MNTSYLKNLKPPIAIIGLGKSGLSALKLLNAAGFSSDQIVTFDDKNPSAQIQDPAKLRERRPQTLVVSPGFSLKTDWIQQMVQEGVFLTSEIGLGASVLSTEKVIGITGSVGKSTVTSLLGFGMKAFDSHSFAGGNLGTPLCDYALRVLQGEPRATWVALELSSYQLENCGPLKLDYSIITFLSANHLERYNDLTEYYMTKMRITEITRTLCVINKTSADAVHYASKAQCPYRLVHADNSSRQDLMPRLFLIGSHNKDNFAVAAEIAIAANWPEKALLEMTHYRGLSHRMEFVANINQVTYVNDSKATAMDSVLVATKGCLENISPSNKLYLLLGGRDKNLPWQDLAVLSTHENINCVFFGACGELARDKSGLHGEYFTKLGSAINFCQKRAHAGDVVLLSPGGTSLDEFKSFEERGDFFKTLVLSEIEA
ncbi:UDP-N-acetylmuramoyl-L-alanine--D-glutamate ligase [Pseudobdellovibrio exovorus]|uniref:Mur ligase central domain-containing protein n=1 Tax=Pseudobdellovibrio exovorus JSS TaxID=1184267 RepID=M4V770_9BACT|nr:UDP-N-acetylmuramoyl-L-alanine--D-glutamate ligase [Pseudobdellovibrio exovorus]AGH94285.1 hypothetical protein A11Q_65 [Pseudobdellovibrio exovorus JSS]